MKSLHSIASHRNRSDCARLGRRGQRASAILARRGLPGVGAGVVSRVQTKLRFG